MYIFITYGSKDIRGVQIRGLRVAEYFDKKDVVFWNSGDGKIIKKEGYRRNAININFLGLIENVRFPKNTKAIIFCDLPTNKAYQISVLLAANKKKIPCVVLDNIYNFSQLKEKSFSNILQYCDCLALNGLSYFNKAEKFNEKIKIIPPLMKKYAIDEKYIKLIKNKYKIKENKEIILSIGYNKDTLEKILKIAKVFEKSKPNLVFIIPGNFKKPVSCKNVIKVPFLKEKELYCLMHLSNLVISKFAYLQLLEILALKKIVIAVGARGLKPEWLEKSLLGAIPYYPEIDLKSLEAIGKLLDKSSPQRKNLQSKVNRIHDGSMDGGKIIADLIDKAVYAQKKSDKIILFAVDKKEEIDIAKKVMRDNAFILPVIISAPWFSSIQNFFLKNGSRQLFDFWQGEKDILPCSFSLLMNFYPSSFHSFSQILPFYDIMVKNIRKLAEDSDKIIVIGEETELLLKNILIGLKYKKINIINKA